MRRRVLISILLVMAATILALGVPLGVVSWRLVEDHFESDVTNRLNSVSTYITDQEKKGSQLDYGQLEVVVPADGQLEIRELGKPLEVVPPGAPADLSDRYFHTLELPRGGTILLSVPKQELRSERGKATALVLAAVLLSLLVGTAIALVLARRLSQPLSDLAGRAARLGDGDFRVFRRRFGIGELDRVADVLDSSASDIAALIGRERDLAGNISHQLRTRLTGLRLGLEELTLTDASSADQIQAALEQTDELVAVVDELLATARSRRAASASELDLSEELASIAADWDRPVTAAGRSLSATCPPGTTVLASPLRLREALGVLVDNAIRHGSGRVTVTVRPGERMVVIEVSDQGVGVPEALVGHIFDRGVSTASSTGIGLGLARAFIEADGGRLELRHASPPVFGIFLAAGQRAVGNSED